MNTTVIGLDIAKQIFVSPQDLSGEPMVIFELVVPGTRLMLHDPTSEHEILAMFSNLESNYFEANSALNLFN